MIGQNDDSIRGRASAERDRRGGCRNRGPRERVPPWGVTLVPLADVVAIGLMGYGGDRWIRA
ncbi:hypothetical protein [Microbacterium sp.]|uniref:hypothetical protein n=1 Tax=Microbacterium sp. TaxID=51671 RepID=UPI003C26DF84